MTSDESLAFIADLADFVVESPSSYHAAAEVARQLTEAGFTELDEREGFEEVSGDQFVRRDGSLIAWRVPPNTGPRSGFRIVGAHTDSPTFKLKPNPDSIRSGWQQVGMEVYGGGLLNSWLDRELGLAGRLVTMDGGVHLVRSGPMLRIPQLAPHLDRSVNEKLQLDRQQHMWPIVGAGDPSVHMLDVLCARAHLDRSELAWFDIFAFTTEPPAVFGASDDLFACPRLDNLSSVHAGLRALIDTSPANDIAVLACFDHEETGSSSRSGANGPVLEDALMRIATGLGYSGDDWHALMARSHCVSADAGHLVHPNYADKHDPGNQPQVNAGPLLKLNANQRYATDAVGAAVWLRACEAADVPTQRFVSNNAVPCGSTIGPSTATRLGVTTVDAGIGLLSMHSAREMCGVDDPWLISRAMQSYWAGH